MSNETSQLRNGCCQISGDLMLLHLLLNLNAVSNKYIDLFSMFGFSSSKPSYATEEMNI